MFHKYLFLNLLSLGFLFFLFACQPDRASADSNGASEQAPYVVRQPAEYDPQEAVWLIWSPVDHVQSLSNEQVTLEIIDQLLPYTRVVVAAANADLYAKAKAAIPASALESGQLELLEIPTEELWTRDMGPNFVELSNGQKAIVDFNFNAWGYTNSDSLDDYTIRMEQFDERIAKLRKLPVISTDLISEGGNREVNGEGVLLLSERVEQGRNPNLSKAQMEAEFQRVLGVKKVIWLGEGLYEDDHTFLGPLDIGNGEKAYTVVTTDGHIDEYARFVNDSTILLAEVDPEDLGEEPIAEENYKRMEENYQRLLNARDQDGNPFKIVRMPLPKLMISTMKPGDSVYDFISTLDYQDGSNFPNEQPVKVIAAASYLNFLISDQVVLGQKYWKAGMDESVKARDEKAKSILQSVFPNRKVVMLDAMAINYGGGGIHCITMQEPKL